ncbi:uncharacterized protein LOC134271821 [Saccostrea cucullata]|uniref:uncharacterized protein LOC134271821 n=1 Tax=Saccostrea cuccullata TaxID=36930 RepID=UPI002ED560F9
MATGVDENKGKKDLQEDIDENKGKKDLQEIIEQINAEEHYRVITKEEYDLLKGQKIPTTPKVEHGLNKGTIPKLPSLGEVPIPSHIPSPGYLHPPSLMSSHQLFNSSALFHQNNNPTPIKLPTFSGSEQVQKGEVSYDVWSYEVRCLKGQWPDHVLLQPVRSSLKGTAREILIPLGEYATVENILAKLDDFYGNVCTPENIMQKFYSDHQQEGESIVSYGSRLEQCSSKAVKVGHIDVNAKDPMLRSKFWSGLRSTQLRNATRHKYETVKEFHSLLREIRQIEQEETSLKSVNSVPKSSVAMSNSFQTNTSNNTYHRGNFRGRNKFVNRGRGMYFQSQNQQQLPNQQHQIQQQTQQPWQTKAVYWYNTAVWLVGESNESDIIVNGLRTKALIDSGSMITCISEEFFKHLNPRPELHDLSEFELNVQSANGSALPYSGYAEIDICVPFFGEFTYTIPVLVVPQTNYSRQVPMILGTNFIRFYRNACNQNSTDSDDVPEQWKIAFDSMNDETPVRTTNKCTIQVLPNETALSASQVQRNCVSN